MLDLLKLALSDLISRTVAERKVWRHDPASPLSSTSIRHVSYAYRTDSEEPVNARLSIRGCSNGDHDNMTTSLVFERL